MNSVSATMSHENARPTKVLTLSTNSRTFCMRLTPLLKHKHHPAIVPDGVWHYLTCRWRSGFLFRRPCRLLAEVVVVGHAAVHVVVQVPLHRALGELLLRLNDLVEDRIVLALGDRRVI